MKLLLPLSFLTAIEVAAMAGPLTKAQWRQLAKGHNVDIEQLEAFLARFNDADEFIVRLNDCNSIAEQIDVMRSVSPRSAERFADDLLRNAVPVGSVQ